MLGIDIAAYPTPASEPDGVSAALAGLLIACVDEGASLGFLADLDTEAATEWWSAQFTLADTVVWVATEQGRVVGCVRLVQGQPANGRHRADVTKLLVHPDARGHGIAAALMSALEREAASRGVTLLVLDTQTGWPAEAIYRQWGWHDIGVVPDYAAFPDGTLGATTFMYKRL